MSPKCQGAFKAALGARNEPPDAPADEASHGRAFFIRRALRALGTLAYTEPGALNAVGDAAFLGLPLGARIRMLFEVWRDGGMCLAQRFSATNDKQWRAAA